MLNFPYSHAELTESLLNHRYRLFFHLRVVHESSRNPIKDEHDSLIFHQMKEKEGRFHWNPPS